MLGEFAGVAFDVTEFAVDYWAIKVVFVFVTVVIVAVGAVGLMVGVVGVEGRHNFF